MKIRSVLSIDNYTDIVVTMVYLYLSVELRYQIRLTSIIIFPSQATANEHRITKLIKPKLLKVIVLLLRITLSDMERFTISLEPICISVGAGEVWVRHNRGQYIAGKDGAISVYCAEWYRERCRALADCHVKSQLRKPLHTLRYIWTYLVVEWFRSWL